MGKKSIWGFITDQYTKVPPVAQADLKDKTIIVVGANTGLGFEAALHFARMGAGKLILACRNKEKGEGAIRRLQEAAGYSRAEVWLLDLAEFASVKAFADRALKEIERLDILLLNAAYASSRDGKFYPTKDGWESALQVNDLSGPLLAFLLLPRMVETAKKHNTRPRTVVVTSEMHYWTSLEKQVFESSNAFELLGSEKYCMPKIMKARYPDSKLLNIFFTRAFSNHLQDKSIIIDSVNPGFCYSEIRRNLRSVFMSVFEWLLARTTEEGSRQLVWAAIGVPNGDEDCLDDLRGAYVSLDAVEEPSDFVLGKEGKQREDKLWEDLISVLEKIDSRVGTIVSQHFL
ncbi:hypothetical protein D9756_002392 [Leucocoprinus leucothites]|uniref:Uncharacterized protein n=1 Tax=Leucocoprinus leucothites TaxID=201217 RepID=A0A8H5GBP8_9AGAR|nr:hypothetical protein D9756_002392 [Leucoagaricus leucothites]